MSDPILATGTLLKISDGSTPPVFTAVAQLKSVTPPEVSRNEIETSVHNLEVGADELWETYICGMLRSGLVTAMLNWLPGDPTHDKTTGLLSKILGNIKGTWQVTFPSGHYAQFKGYVSKFTPESAEPDNVLGTQVTIRPTGPIEFFG